MMKVSIVQAPNGRRERENIEKWKVAWVDSQIKLSLHEIQETG